MTPEEIHELRDLQSAFRKLKWAATKPVRFDEGRGRWRLHRSPGLTGPEAYALWQLLSSLDSDLGAGRLVDLDAAPEEAPR